MVVHRGLSSLEIGNEDVLLEFSIMQFGVSVPVIPFASFGL